MNDWFEAERRIERAQQLSEAHQWAEALEEMDAALAINPNNAAWHAQRGYVLDELDRFADAVDAYERALELEPGDRDVLAALGVELSRVGRFARALEVFEELSRFFPDFEPAYCQRIAIFAELGRHEEAEEMFYLAQELNDKCPHCFFHVGVSLAERGESERAMFCWQRVLELDSGYLGVRQLIGQAYRADGKLDEARQSFIEELRNDPGNTEILLQLAELALEAGELETASAKFRQIIELEPDHAAAHVGLGKVLLRLERPEEALQAFHEGARQAPEEQDELEVPIAEALLHLRRFGEARDRLTAAVERDSKDTTALMLLGHALVAGGGFARATDCYRRLLALDDRNPLAHHMLGVCLVQTRQWEAGLEHCLAAVEQQPDFVAAMHNAVLICAHLGKWRDAKRLLERALRADPGNEALCRVSKRMWRYRLRFYARRCLLLSGPGTRPFSR